MLRTFLRTKIHRARVTRSDIDYVGSITIDEDLMKAAQLVPLETVDVYNITTGARFTTYCIPGEPGSGEIGINGAAAHLAKVGHLVIVAAYCMLDTTEIATHQAQVVLVDELNQIRETRTQSTTDSA